MSARRRYASPPVPERRPQLQIVAPAASPEEAAAVVAALEPLPARDDAGDRRGARRPYNPWQRAALLEGTGREPDAPSPWGDPIPW